MLTAMSEMDPTLPARMAAFQKGLQAFGWAEGRNLSIVSRHATSDLDRLKSAALELVAAAPELIVVWSNPAVMARRIRVSRRSGWQRVCRKIGTSGRQADRLDVSHAGSVRA